MQNIAKASQNRSVAEFEKVNIIYVQQYLFFFVLLLDSQIAF